ncbi:MAG: cell division FtsZ family protein [Helicobacteraceae bacterium]|jgi:cell division protein FtsZ|nr:cell division FtsZ family protein [Helicobacteraceae bacterium]
MSKSNVSDLFMVKESEPNVVSAKAIGVGDGGANIIDYLLREGQKGIDMIVADTDDRSLDASLAPTKIRLGEKLTRGRGSNGDLEIGRQAAEESYDQIKEALKGKGKGFLDLTFIVAGFGGGTGGGACSVVARAAKENGSLTIGVCAMPFSFEGAKRSELAKKGLEALRSECDSVIVIPNEKTLSTADKNIGRDESFAMANAALANAVKLIGSIALVDDKTGIYIDFFDLEYVIKRCKGKKTLIGAGYSEEGSDSASVALKAAIESALGDNLNLNDATSVIARFQLNPSYSLMAIQSAMRMVFDASNEDSDVLFGTSIDDSLKPEEICATVIVAGFPLDEPDAAG